jgi:cytochrome d ubiquinol oxidase subunit II
MIDLPFIWAGIIAFAVLAYVIADGFDLGIGILFPLLARERDRDTAMNSVAPVWDGNETWLVLGGGGLFAAFPLAYAVVLPALYAPLIAMLLALVFRGVAFEFRWRTVRGRFVWDWAFAGGSTLAALCQGVVLGAILQGIRVSGRAYGGGWFDWLTPFSIITGMALVVGYALLGATWLMMKTTGALREQARRFALFAGVGTVVLIGVVSLWTPFLSLAYLDRWFAFPAILYTLPVPLAVAGAAYLLFAGLRTAKAGRTNPNGRHDRDAQPFLAALALFVLSYVGLGISLYPDIVPPDITIRRAAAPDQSLAFLLVGTVILVPIIIAYMAHAYWVFRGKVDVTGGYHE